MVGCSTKSKFYYGKDGESPWNNDLHHKHTLENENNYYDMLKKKTFNPDRDRNPFALTLDEVVSDETSSKKFAVRQTNGIRPVCSHRSEPNTQRRLDQTMSLMRDTNSLLANAIPDLKAQVESTNSRIQRLERRRGINTRRSNNFANGDTLGSERFNQTTGRSSMNQVTTKRRAQSALSVRSGMSSVLVDAQDVLHKASGVLETRPQTAKTTKTILSHRNRNGWGCTLRDGDIIKHAGRNLPKKKQYNIEVDHATGELRHRAVKPRPATALGIREPSCRRVPGYQAPLEDYGRNPPGAALEDEAFYVRPEDLGLDHPGQH